MTESVPEIVPLRGTLRDYAWGSRGFISDWLGLKPTTGPEAEWWMGAHPSAPSQVSTASGWISLAEWIAKAPAERLGEHATEAFGPELPFLFKILAAEHPLSLQAHPDLDQARAGYAREEAAGTPHDAAERNYRDPHPKPELLCALTPFDALVGFRSCDAIANDIEALGNDALRAHLAPMRLNGEAGLQESFAALWASPTDAWLDGLVAACAARRAGPADALVLELAGAYPGDVGVISPLLLNLVHLEPGEAIYLPARQLHSYVRGAGLELMANSDNVLRGGLTPKHVDPAELASVLDFRAGAPMRVTADEASPGEFVYRSPAGSFELSRIEVRGNHQESGRRGLAILLCGRGEGRLRAVGQAMELVLGRGEACVVSGRVDSLEILGDMDLYRAALPSR